MTTEQTAIGEIAFSIDDTELEIYIGGYFLCSTDIDKLSNQAIQELPDNIQESIKRELSL